MCKKLAVLLSLVMVLGLAGGASAGTWTNGDGDNDWCNPANWNPPGIPTSTTDVVISGTPNDTVVIDATCDAQARSVDWNVDADQEVRIEAGGSLTVQLGFDWSDGSETATLRIAGDLTIHGTGLDDSDHFRGPDGGTGLVFIELGANVYVEGQFRGADSSSGRLDVYMSGGDVNCLKYKCGDDGDGDFRMTGGRFVTRDTGLSDSFTIRGRGGGTFDVLIEGGAELWVAGGLMTPQNAEAKADVKINEATISCDEWVAQGPRWVVDINDNGELRIRESDGATKTLVEGWIDANQVIGKGGTLPPQITWDGPDLVLIIFFVHKTVYDPDPPDDAIDVCPDAVLSWSTGVYVADHNVYFGTDMNEVNEVGVPKQIHVGPNSWDPPGLLALNTTYYWRVDTVNDACAPYKWEGGIWSFTTSDGNAFAVSPEDGETGIVVDSNLVWNACEYTSFDVYFSLEVNDVNDRVVSARIATGITETTVDPCAGDLTPSRTYYWAVDKYVGPVKSEGDVWSFRSKPDIVDFDMIAWYKLDEGTGGDVFDASGYEHHADLDGPEDHWRNDGRWDGSRWFDDESDGTDVELPFELTSEITDKMSVSMWLLNSNRPGSDNWAFGIGDEDDYSFRAAVPAEDGQTLYFQAGNDTNDVLEWDMKRDGINPASLEDWHLYVFVKDEVANFTKIYFDAEVVDACDAVDQTLTNIAWAPGKLGAVPWHDSDLVAQMDDVRFFKKALSDGDVEELFRGGDVAKAWKPDPPSGATDVDTDVEPSWRSGNFATHHDVYFGKDHAAVRDDDIANSLGAYKGRQVVADTNWAPASELELGETYYWRIDEVNEANNPDDIWKGDVWSFTVANYVVIDDFEDYDDTNRIYHAWEDGQINGTGSYIDLGTEPFSPAHGGYQSMLYTYDNKIQWDYEHYWSVVELPFEGPTDLTNGGETRVLTLYFYGDPDNDANDTEELYVALDGSYDEVRYTDDAGQDNNDLKLAEWTEWNIPLSDFAVDTTAATRLHIGFGDRNNTTIVGGDGIAFFDDVRLYPPRCVPEERKPDADLSNNCIVDWADVAIMSDQWLRSDLDLNPVTNPGDANLVGHWELEGNADDSSGNNYHGTAEGDYEWTAGRIGTGAIDLDGGWVVVEDEGNTPKLRPKDQVSATAWIYLEGGSDYRVVIKGEDDEETFGLEVHTDDGLAFIFRDANSPGDVVDVRSGSTLPRDEWIHTGGTYDANEQSCYVNGVVEDSNTRGALEIFSDVNDGMAIGGRYGDTSQRFNGKIDDVRVYNRGLTRAEVAWLASEGDGEILLDSAANFYDGESPEAINMRDLAVLLLAWGQEKLWPE